MIEYKVKVYDNRTEWRLNGKLHREDGPAIEYDIKSAKGKTKGNKFWYLNGKQHREDGPASEWNDGNKFWYLNGKQHREDGPASEWNDGTKHWYINGKQLSQHQFNNRNGDFGVKHSTLDEILKKFNIGQIEGKCFIRYKGIELYYLNGKLHREDGPAVCGDGDKEWYLNGKLHREDGPAIIGNTGWEYHYINGEFIPKKEFINRNKVELTMDEIATKFNIDVNDLKIKK